ncbi:MAG: hypothetical protein ABSB74_13005, partial [Tepidisphaeraceae bacterium]
MPLSINVGLSRKASKDYQSTGVSINVTAELDQALLARPDELQRQIGDLYCQAQNALDHQADALGDPQPRRNGQNDRGRDRHNGYDRHKGYDRHDDRRDAAMTASQRRAILAIVKRWDINLDAECRDYTGEEF